MNILRNRQLQTAIIILMMSLGGIFIMQQTVFAATTDTSDGSFTLNAAPAITLVDFVDSSYALTSTLTPDNSQEFGVNYTLTHSGQMSDIKNVTIYIFDDSVHGVDAADGVVSAAPDGLQLVKITWIESSDTYVLDDGALTGWTVDPASSIDPGTGGTETTFEFSTQFDISRVARADTDWNVTATVYDDDAGTPETDSDSETAFATVSAFFDITFSVATFSWGSAIQPLSINNTHGALSINFTANAAFELRLSAIDFTPGPIDVEANNILMWDEDGSVGGQNSAWIRNTIATMLGTGATGWDAQAALGDELGDTRNVYIFLTDPGSLFSVSTLYTTTVTVTIQADV